MAFQLTNKTIYIITPEKWGIMKLSKHHYAAELAERGNRVYFIEPPDLSVNGILTEKVAGYDSLYLVKYKPINRGERYLPAFVYRWLLRMQIKRIVKHVGIRPDVVWCFHTFYF